MFLKTRSRDSQLPDSKGDEATATSRLRAHDRRVRNVNTDHKVTLVLGKTHSPFSLFFLSLLSTSNEEQAIPRPLGLQILLLEAAWSHSECMRCADPLQI